MIKELAIFVTATIIFAFSTSALAGWELYDDFSTETIDTQKWGIDNSSATISVENGKAKFVHQSGNPNDSAYLYFSQDPEDILGIQAKIFIEACSGDVRARIAAYAGKEGENHVWSGLQLQPGDQRIYSSSGLEGPPPTYTWVKNLHYAHFQSPITVIGASFDLTMEFASDKITYEVDGLGKIVYKYATSVAAPDDFFRAIGTRSTNGEGPCTVYFDDVYVLRP